MWICTPLVSRVAEAGTNCKCKGNGRDFKLGQVTCIRGYLARCEMFLNNTSWKKIADECPQAQLVPPPALAERLRAPHGTNSPPAY